MPPPGFCGVSSCPRSSGGQFRSQKHVKEAGSFSYGWCEARLAAVGWTDDPSFPLPVAELDSAGHEAEMSLRSHRLAVTVQVNAGSEVTGVWV